SGNSRYPCVTLPPPWRRTPGRTPPVACSGPAPDNDRHRGRPQAAHWMAHVMTLTDSKIHAAARIPHNCSGPAHGCSTAAAIGAPARPAQASARHARSILAAALLAAALSLLLGGCASGPPPRDALAAAQTALARAEAARAADFAPVDLDFARRQLQAAEGALANRDDALAERLAVQAELNAELAAAKSRAAAARAQVQRRTD